MYGFVFHKIQDRRMGLYNRINFWRHQTCQELMTLEFFEKLSEKSLEKFLMWQYKTFLQGSLKMEVKNERD